MKIRRKGGVSNVVATVLIILITIAAITLIWAAIIPLVKRGLNLDPLVSLTIDTSSGYTLFDKSEEIASVKIKRGSDDVDLGGINIIFTIDGNSQSFILGYDKDGEPYFPLKNQARTISFLFYNLGYKNVEKVAVGPIFKEAKQGVVYSEVSMPSGKIAGVPDLVFYRQECAGLDKDESGDLLDPSGSTRLDPNEVTSLGVWWDEDCNEGNSWCDGSDIDQSRKVDDADQSIILSRWGRTTCCDGVDCSEDWLDDNWCGGADINKEGKVDDYDLGLGGKAEYLKVAKCVP